MVTPGELLVTLHALEGFVARVPAVVPLQLIRSRKLPVTLLPCALEWLLAGVDPDMCLQVGALGVLLATARVFALVILFLQAQLSFAFDSFSCRHFWLRGWKLVPEVWVHQDLSNLLSCSMLPRIVMMNLKQVQRQRRTRLLLLGITRA